MFLFFLGGGGLGSPILRNKMESNSSHWGSHSTAIGLDPSTLSFWLKSSWVFRIKPTKSDSLFAERSLQQPSPGFPVLAHTLKMPPPPQQNMAGFP